MLSVYIDRDLGRLKQVRIAQALTATAPPWARIVQDVAQADLQILQVVALDARRGVKAPRYAIIQHAQRHEHRHGARAPIVVPSNFNPWEALWSKALAIWSPVGISVAALNHQAHLYLAPFGVDTGVFRPSGAPRDVGLVTTGVSNVDEPIEEAAAAALRAGLTVTHVGPFDVEGMNARVSPGMSAVNSLSDNELAALYSRARWVSGLRYKEGFELPALEGLACGARPICFDTPENREVFKDHALYVHELAGDALVDQLTTVMSQPARPVGVQELNDVALRYDWERLAVGYWQALQNACAADASLAPRIAAPPPTHRTIRLATERKRRLLWIGDSPTTAWTGFGRAAFNILKELQARFDVHVIGTTYDGCPYDRTAMPYDVYPISKGVPEVLRIVQPDVVLAQHDPWHVQNWLRDAGKIPVVAIMPIDGTNCRCDYLNELAMAVWWTKWSEQEARIGGYTGPSCVVPLGVDLSIFKPLDRQQARTTIGLPAEVHDKFIVGCVARNQPRKRLDLLVRHFAEWVKSRGIDDAYLYVQTAPTGESAYDVASLMRYERLESRMLLVTPALYRTLPETTQAGVYNSLDVYFTTTQGEGWGLPVMEAMACGVPCIVPEWSALADWAKDAAVFSPCGDISGTINSFAPMSGTKIAVLGGVPNKADNVAALDRLYRDAEFYGDVRARGLALVERPEFRWPAIGQGVLAAVENALIGRRAGGVLQPVLEETT